MGNSFHFSVFLNIRSNTMKSFLWIMYKMSKTKTVKKPDFLEVDKSVPGQNFACISFISPDKVLKDKNIFMFQRFLEHKQKEMKEEDLQEEYQTFLGMHGKKLDEEFGKRNDFQTSVRGVKVRGVYDTYREAEVRAKVLQRLDRSFNVYVGQVGYWLPWDPNPDTLENQEYLESDLNNLMKQYKENESTKDTYYQEQVKEKKTAALKENKEREAEGEKTKEKEAKGAETKEGFKEEEQEETQDTPHLERKESYQE